MPDQTAIPFWASLVERCSTDFGWKLSQDDMRQYAEYVSRLVDRGLVDDSELQQVLSNYHYDHTLVEALRDQRHPAHAERWASWSQQALGILLSRYRNIVNLDQPALSLEDLAQEAMHDLWRALPAYHYRSRFQTWAFTVISNCFVRAYRSARTQKRQIPGVAVSLEDAGELDCHRANSSYRTPDESAMASSLLSLSQQILSQHHDTRLRAVFYMWAQEDQPLRVIGAQLNLSVPRVHALLSRALEILRTENSLKHWNSSSLE